MDSAKDVFERLDGLRHGVLRRARECAALTIPSLLPPEGHDEGSELLTPYQGMGARCVNNLSSKLILALLPPNSPYFRFLIDDDDVTRLSGDPKQRTMIERGLAEMVRVVQRDVEESNSRPSLNEVAKLLVATGNALLHLGPDGNIRYWGLGSYVVRRDVMGNTLETVIKESVSPSTLTDEVKVACEVTEEQEGGKVKDQKIDVYTYIKWGLNTQDAHQEINGIVVPDSEGSWPKDEPAYIPLRLSSVAGENYGRGLIEEYLGDLRSLEGLTKSIVLGSAAAAKVLFLRAPNATTKAKDIAEKETGAVINGRADDITTLQLDKFPDFRIALETIDRLNQRLSHAFLLNASIQRSGERVTAEEIRYMAQELEDGLGGIYTVLSRELQLPLTKRRIAVLRKRNKLPALPKGIARPAISTGLEALGRGHDARSLRAFFEDIAPLGPEVIQQWVNVGDMIQRSANAHGIDSDGLVRTPEEVENSEMNNQIRQLLQSAGPGAIQEIIKQVGAQGGPGGNVNG